MFVVAAGTSVPERGEGDSAAVGTAMGELPRGTPVVGLVARLQPWKGQDRLVRAAALLRERGHELHVLLVGGDSWALAPEYAGELPRLIAELGWAITSR